METGVIRNAGSRPTEAALLQAFDAKYPVSKKKKKKKERKKRKEKKRNFSVQETGAWVAQLVKHLTSAQVMILQFVSSSPTSVSVLTAQSLEPASDCLPPSLSAPPPLSLFFSKINIRKKKYVTFKF